MIRRLLAFLVLLVALPAFGQEAARPWMGIAIESGTQGVRVKQVIDATPAARAGLKSGDEVRTIDGKPVATPADLVQKVQEKGVGEKVVLSVARASETLTITLNLEARPDEVQVLKDHLLGKPAPAFALTDSQGAYPAKLADLAGKVVVVEFWATWCPPCNASMPRLTAWQEKYGKKGLRIVGISAEDWPVIAGHATKKHLGYTVASDPEATITQKYEVPAIPTIVVIDQKGVVRFVDVGGGEKLDDAEKILTALLDAPKN